MALIDNRKAVKDFFGEQIECVQGYSIFGNWCHSLVGFEDRNLDYTCLGLKERDAWAAGAVLVQQKKKA